MSHGCSESVIEEIRYGAEKELGRVPSLLDRAKNRIGAVSVDTFITIVMEAGGPSSSVYAGNITGVVGLEVSLENTCPLLLKRTAKAETWVAILQAGWRWSGGWSFFLRGCNE